MAAKDQKGTGRRKPVKTKAATPKVALPPVNIEPVQYEGLTHLQNLFVFWMARLGNGAEAARKAGYSKVRAKHAAYELMQQPGVAAAVRAETKRHIEELGVDESWVKVRLVAQSNEYLATNPAASIRATEVLGKTLGMFRDQVDHTIGLRLSHEEALAQLE